MTMVYVWIVRVAVEHPDMGTRMTMTHFCGDISAMLMLMVLIVTMSMVMNHRSVPMLVLMPFRQVQPNTNRHEGSCNEKRKCDSVYEEYK
jgi:hypothetical protein